MNRSFGVCSKPKERRYAMASPAQAPIHADHSYHCACTQEFHDTVVRSLAKLDAGQEAILGRLDKINGSVAELFRRTNDHGQKLAVIEEARHEAKAAVDDLEERVTANEKAVGAQQTAAGTAGKIFGEMKPVIMLALGAFLFLVLSKARDMVEILAGKGL
jgi:hypothetical protein